MNDFEINPRFCVRFLGYTWQGCLKYTRVKLQTLQDKAMTLLLEKNFSEGISSVLGGS